MINGANILVDKSTLYSYNRQVAFCGRFADVLELVDWLA